jgi:hypothetical protein
MQFGYLLNVVILSRLFYGFKDEPVQLKKIFIVIAFQFASLLILQLSFKTVLLAILLVALNVVFYFFERKIKALNPLRLISIFVVIIIFGIFSSFFIPDTINPNVISFINEFKNNSAIFLTLSRINWQKSNLIFCGGLFLLNEINFGIRYFFEIFGLRPQEDKKEYSTGRIIGMLERIMVYFFVLAGQYAAIGFIIAAKGFTRFKDLDKRNFAEYVLVGTLLSSFSAIIVASVVKGLMQIIQ